MTWLHILFKFKIIITENYFGFMESLGIYYDTECTF